MEERETCPTALLLRQQYAQWKKDADATFERAMAEFERIFGAIPKQSKEGK